MATPSFDPGFTEKYQGKLQRVINSDGQFNVRRRGSTWRDIHPYLFMIDTSWPVFAVLIFAGYVIANLLFALLYLGIGLEHLRGAQTGTFFERFLSAVFFSAQTFTTVGYGSVSPDGFGANLAASFEALVGLMAFAVATGLLFGRFSRPAARLEFSHHILVAPYGSGASLQFRVANRRTNNLMEIRAEVLMMTVEPSDQGLKRKYRPLALERNTIVFMPLTWTVVHPIDESSPLWGMTAERLAQMEGEFLILVKAFDETFSQTIHVRRSYRHEELIWGARFVPAFEPDTHGRMELDLDRISEIAAIESASGTNREKDRLQGI